MTADRTCPLCLVDRGSLQAVTLGNGKTLTLACGQCAVALRPFLAMLRSPNDPDALREMDSFVLRIALGDDAMNDRRDVARTLDVVAEHVRVGYTDKLIIDENGNTVGSWKFHTHSRPVPVESLLDEDDIAIMEMDRNE